MRIGCDLVLVSRISRLSKQDAFLDKVFHPKEVEYCRARGVSAEMSFAARFACKEAFGKALGTGIFAEGVSPKEIWIENEPNGRPILRLSEFLESRVGALGFTRWEVSISHQGEYAMATVLLF
jgi:holo-[acyl-carrier protein] synthase